MFNAKKISDSERARLLDYLIFKLQHGGNIVSAMKSYMEGNKAKSSRPIQVMLDRIGAGEDFVDLAHEFGLVDRYGHIILSAGVEPSKSLPVIRDFSLNRSFGVTAIIVREVIAKWAMALLCGLSLVADAGRQPLVSIYQKMNDTAVATGAAAAPLPAYLAQPWLTTWWVLAIGGVLLAIGAVAWWMNKYQTHAVYRIARFRFYEDWSSLLSLYLAFKASGQSDFKAAQSLAAACPEGSFTHGLFTEMSHAMKLRGRSFYDVLAEHEGAIPSQVLNFFLDASKTGQVDAYLGQARDYCQQRVESLTKATGNWLPALTGIALFLGMGLMIADLFVKLTVVTMKPLTG